MGFFDSVENWFSSAFHKTESVVSTLYHDLTGGAKTVYHDINHDVSKVLDTGTDIVKTAAHTSSDAIHKVGTIGDHVVTGSIKTISHTVDKTEDAVKDVSHLGESLGTDVKSSVSTVATQGQVLGTNIGRNAEGAISTTVKQLPAVTSNLQWPLIAAAGVGALYLMNKK